MASQESQRGTTEVDFGTANTLGKDDYRKLFVGGLSWDTNEKNLREHFTKYGDIESLTLKMDPTTGRSRGFAFIVFADADSLDKVVDTGDHIINGKKVDPKKARPPGVNKIFVGGLAHDISDEVIRSYFAKFGKIVNIETPTDKVQNRRRGFCFVTFDSDEAVFTLLKSPRQMICGREVEIKKAQPQHNVRHHAPWNPYMAGSTGVEPGHNSTRGPLDYWTGSTPAYTSSSTYSPAAYSPGYCTTTGYDSYTTGTPARSYTGYESYYSSCTQTQSNAYEGYQGYNSYDPSAAVYSTGSGTAHGTSSSTATGINRGTRNTYNGKTRGWGGQPRHMPY